MTKAERIVAYIKECFESFHIDFNKYFFYDFEDEGFEEIVWVDDKGKICMPAIEYASEILGISVEDIVSRNEDAPLKWLRKYPFFWHFRAYEYSYEKSFYVPEYESIRMVEVIFESDLRKQYPLRYNYHDVIKRMKEKLKLQNLVEPGVFHEGAMINNLRISTENFCSFDEIEEMTNSFINMIKNATQLFLKTLHTDLSDEEQNEYNLLVSALGLRDRFYTDGYLYYNQLLKVRAFYRDLNEQNFNDSIVFMHCLDFKPWRYSEFINNKELVQKYLNVVPQAKAAMREYAVEASVFKCVFEWSDAQPITFTPEVEQLISEVNASIGEKEIPLEKRSKELSSVKIDKTAEEFNGEEKTAEILMSYCRPAKLGGLPIRIPTYDLHPQINTQAAIRHISALLGKIEHNNFIERVVARNNRSGGSGNE